MSGGADPCATPGALFQSSSADLDRLLDNVGAMVPGLTTDVLTMVAWNTIEDFYQRSTYRREHVYWQLDPQQIVLNFDPYDSNWRVCRFLYFSGLQNVKFIPPGRVQDVTYPTPDTERTGEALLALKPNNLNVALPYDVWTTYFEALMNGVLHRLYMQPGKPYSDMQAAQLHGRLYRSGISSARADAQAQHLREGSSWQYPYFAVGGHADGRQGL